MPEKREVKKCRNFYTPKQVKSSSGDVWYYRTNKTFDVFVDAGTGEIISFKIWNRRHK